VWRRFLLGLLLPNKLFQMRGFTDRQQVSGTAGAFSDSVDAGDNIRFN